MVLSSWECPGRIDGPGAFLKIRTKKSVTPRPGRDDPYNPEIQRPGRISASPDILMSGLPRATGGTTPAAILQDCPLSMQKMRETPEQKKRQLTTLNALPKSFSPRLQSRCPRSSRGRRPTRSRRDFRSGKTRRTAPSPSVPSSCESAAHPPSSQRMVLENVGLSCQAVGSRKACDNSVWPFKAGL